MKTLLLLLWCSLTLAQTMAGQTQTFDIATFVPPRRWSQSVTNGVLLLQDRKTIQGRTQFCQIYLFPSQMSNASPTVNFQNEWDAKVVRALGFKGRPSAQPQTGSDGWTTLTDHADMVSQGVPLRVVLLTATGFGRYMSFVVSVSPNAYENEIEDFFKNADLHAPGQGQNPQGPSAPAAVPASPTGPDTRTSSTAQGSLANYVYLPPPGWSRQEMPDRVVLTSPVYSNGEACQLTMLPFQTSTQTLDYEGIGAFRAIFQADPLSTYPSPPPRLARGVSPQGWEYFTIHKLVGGQEGESRTRGAILFMAKVDGQIATIVGTSKDFIVSNCFGLTILDVWPAFLSTLQFKNARPSGQEHAAVQQRLTGNWIMATGGVGLYYTFQANGRYADAAASQIRTRVSSTEVLATTTGFFGDGAYSFEGNTLVMKRDDNQVFTFFFRLEQVSRDSGRTWKDELSLLKPGASGEVRYRRD